ncbi:hypothetical protein LINPERHAP1_LOCUS38443 [Linum perenne]
MQKWVMPFSCSKKCLTDFHCQAIPKWFVEEYGAQLSNSILLKLPNGVKWKLKLFRRGGKIWFNDFLVKIFSCNASEIRYPARDLAN